MNTGTPKMQCYSSSPDSFFSSPQTSPLNERKRKRMISELQKGRRAVSELHHQFLFHNSARDRVSAKKQVSAAELLARIISSFLYCISLFPDAGSDYTMGGSDQRREQKRETSNKGKTQKGSSKRRKISQTKVVETTDLTDDGFAWRKYGQKPIKSSPHPRDYYKCTYWKDEDCQATKWVQKVSDEPSIYHTIYKNEHICKNFARSSHLTTSGLSSPSYQNECHTYVSFGVKSNHPWTPTGASITDQHQEHECNSSVTQTSSSSSSSIILQDVVKLEVLNSNGNLPSANSSDKNHEMETVEMIQESPTTMMKTMQKNMNRVDYGVIQFSSTDLTIDLPSSASMVMENHNQYYVTGDAISPIEALCFPSVNNYNYMTMQDNAMSHNAFDNLLNTYVSDVL